MSAPVETVELYRAVIDVQTPNGRSRELIIFKRQSTPGEIPEVWLSLDATMRNTIVLNTAELMQVVDHLISAELSNEE